MVRTGTFGRLPRSVPSLTATLIALAREQQQQEDQNIMDAWQKGGSVDGKKVTDDMVLKYWQGRLTGISKDDPLYDTYRNAIQQYQYVIAESKMTAQYAQIADPKAGDDQKMSAFYMNWAKRIPKDSEFYRVLLRDAGQYIRSAKAKRDSINKISAEKQYTAQLDRLEKTNELPGQTALRVITLLAQEGSGGQGAVLGESPLGNPSNIANTTNIADLNLPSVDQMVALIGTLAGPNHLRGPNAGDRATAGSPSVLFTDENGKPVTGQDVHDMFKAMDPTFSGQITMPYLQGLIAKQRDGLQKRIDLAKKTGHVSDMMQLTMQQAKVNEFGREIAAWPVAHEYADLHAKLGQAQADALSGKLTPDAAAAAINGIRSQIGALADDKRIAADGKMQSQLRGEANGVDGTLTLAEDLEGTRTASGQGQSEVAQTNATLELFQTQKDSVDAGEMVYTQGDYVKAPDGTVKFVPGTQGKSIGAATMADVNNLPGVGKPVPVMVPNGDGGGATPMYVVPAPIMASVTNPDGTPMQSSNHNPIGGYIRYSVNGKDVTLYSIERNGTTEWTTDPPWDTSKAKTSESGGVLTVDLYPNGTSSPFSALKPEDYLTDHDLGNGFAIVGSKTNQTTGEVTPGQIVYNPKPATLGTDNPRQVAGHDPYTDSFSASIAAAKTSPDGPQLLQQWTGDPRFVHILDQNAHMSAGQTLMTGPDGTQSWVGGDQAAYQRSMEAATRDLSYAKTGNASETNPALGDAWWKDSTFTQMDGAPATTVRGPNGQAIIPSQNVPLATNVIQNTPGSNLMGLADAFHPSGQLKTPSQSTGATPAIRMGQALTLPSVPGASMTPPTLGPTASYTPPASSTVPTTSPTYDPGHASGGSGYKNGPSRV